MFVPSIGFMAAVGGVALVVGIGAGMKVTSDHYLAKEADRPAAVVRVKEVMRLKDERQLGVYRGKVNELEHLNKSLRKEIEYARSQVTGNPVFGPSFILVWDSKLAGRPLGVPGDPARASEAAGGAGVATVDDLTENHAVNAVKWGKDRVKINAIREWACRVQKQGCNT